MSASKALGPNAELIGQPGSRERLATPALVLDLDQLDANIAAMATHASEHNYALRPTMKIHKSVEIARRQVAAGPTLGVCCATLSEAEAMVDGGIPGVMLFSSVVSAAKVERVAALNARAEDLVVAVDSLDNAMALATAARASGRALALVVDFEVGGGRTGIADCDTAVALARAIAETDGVEYAGVQGYVGLQQVIVDYEERERVTRDYYAPLVALVEQLRAEGLPPRLITGGGTGTHAIEAELGVLTEVQVGTYVFMDVSYLPVVMTPSEPRPFGASLFVRTTVISAAQPGFVVTDAGAKELDGYLAQPTPTVVRGAPPQSAYSIIGDDLGRVELTGGARLSVGDAIEVIPRHCWQTAALHNVYHVVRDDTLVDIWPLVARDNR